MTELAHAYRGILRELRKSAVAPRKSNKTIVSNFRSIAIQYQKSGDPIILQDIRNALLFLRSQREHKLLLERYNPWVDLTAEERIKATARRVGLDMPSVARSGSALICHSLISSSGACKSLHEFQDVRLRLSIIDQSLPCTPFPVRILHSFRPPWHVSATGPLPQYRIDDLPHTILDSLVLYILTLRRVGLTSYASRYLSVVLWVVSGILQIVDNKNVDLVKILEVLKCDPSSIHFHRGSDQPEITCSDTLNALRTASHHLVDLLEPVAFPTETVYGLGAMALSTPASNRIFTSKGRPADNPLIVHVSSFKMLHSLLPKGYVLSRAYQALIKHLWPGALTLLFPRDAAIVPSIITAGHSTVAIRMPSHPVARGLIAVANAPLAAPSANTSGKPSPTRANHVFRDLNGKVSIILDGGACEVGLESTVVDGLHEDGKLRVLRPGGITVEDIQRVLREELHDCNDVPDVLVHRRDYMDEGMEQAPTTPGMKYRHYSPSVPLTLLMTSSRPPTGQSYSSAASFLVSLRTNQTCKVGVLAPADSALWDTLPMDGFEWFRYPLGLKAEPSVSAHRLFDGLLTLEQKGVDFMLIEEMEEDREGLAVMNRVRKAAGDVRWITFE